MEPKGYEAATTATRPSILIVADEADVVRMIRLVLSEIGARLDAANNDDAPVALNAMRPDLTLLDIGAIFGLDLLRSMRMASTCPLIVLTTLTHDSRALRRHDRRGRRRYSEAVLAGSADFRR